MRILIWHGYLLGGTGSNVYTRALAREWSRAGHDVTVVCQERHPERYDLGGARVVVPELPARLLPVFVLDEYEGLDARLLPDFTPEQRDAYVEANAAALRELLPADLVFANHVLMGGAGGARAAPVRVKAHGSELEYSMRGNAELRNSARRRLPARTSSSSAPSTSAACSRTSSVTSSASTMCRPESTSTSSACCRATRRSPPSSRSRRREPESAGERHPGCRQRGAVRRVLRRATHRPSSTSGS